MYKGKIILGRKSSLCVSDVRDLLIQMQTVCIYQNLMRYENILMLPYIDYVVFYLERYL